MASGLKYGHLAKPDSEFASMKPMIDAFSKKLWDRPLNSTREMLKTPIPYPDFVPSTNDIIITERKAPVSDGTEIGIKIYKSKNTPDDAVLFYSMHGGGWVVGSHGVEEVMNRFVAAKTHCVVVSVDYRM